MEAQQGLAPTATYLAQAWNDILEALDNGNTVLPAVTFNYTYFCCTHTQNVGMEKKNTY